MNSLWQITSEKPSFPALSESFSTDVAIIGGGMVGILTAYILQSHGISCCVIEKNSVGSGTTAGTTAKITSQHGLIYHTLLKKLGKEKAQLYYHLNQSAVDKFRTLAKKYPCELESKDNFIYSSVSRTKIYEEIQALYEIGADAQLFDCLPVPFSVAGAVCFPNQAQFNPLKLIYSIAKELNIYENTLVTNIRKGTVITSRGNIRAEKIIVCSHFPFIDRRGMFFMKMYQHRSYVTALEGAPDFDDMYLDEKADGISLRNSGSLLLIGGGDHRTGKKGGGYGTLKDIKDAFFPTATEKCSWAAQDCMTLDGIPYVGQYSKATPDLFVATGFNKWGMTSSMVAAELLFSAVTDKEHPAKELFDPSRSMLHPQLLLNGVDFALSVLTPVPKRCTHLGCALKYNKAEKSWDCSCHGSRFDEKGEVLDGPGIEGLGIRD